MRTLLVVIVSMLAGMAMAAEPVEWKVVSVHDGDTAKDIATSCPRYAAGSFKPLD